MIQSLHGMHNWLYMVIKQNCKNLNGNTLFTCIFAVTKLKKKIVPHPCYVVRIMLYYNYVIADAKCNTISNSLWQHDSKVTLRNVRLQ